jgi:hypothetical protein
MDSLYSGPDDGRSATRAAIVRGSFGEAQNEAVLLQQFHLFWVNFDDESVRHG